MSSQLELDVAAAIEILDVIAKASQEEAERQHQRAAASAAAAAASAPAGAVASSNSNTSSPRGRTSTTGSEPIDFPAIVPGQTSMTPLNRDDLDAGAAVAFVFETTAGAGLTATWGRALVVAKLDGHRGWWSAPLVARVFSVGAGISLGARRCATLAFLGEDELEKLKLGKKLRVRVGPSLCLAVPSKASSSAVVAPAAPAAATAGSPGERGKKSSGGGFHPSLYRSPDLGFDFDFSIDSPPDYRVSRGAMADFSLRVGALVPCDKLTKEALKMQQQHGKEKVDRAALLSGRAPFDAPPKVLRPLARRLNQAAGLEHRPGAPWPGL